MSSSGNKEQCCTICWEPFDSEKVLPIVYSCGHNICQACDENPENEMEKCHVCRKPITSRVKNINLIEMLKTLEIMCKEIEELDDPEVNFQCSNCQEWAVQENMHICKTCIIDEGLLELTEVPLDEKAKKVVELSMCSNCIIPMHCYEGHEIVAMFPIWSRFNISIRSSRIHLKLENFKDGCQVLDQMFSDFMTLSIGNFKAYNVLNDMARKIVRRSRNLVEIEAVPSNCKSKLEEFQQIHNLCDQTISSYKLLWTELIEQCKNLLGLASTNNTTKQQKYIFDAIEKIINEAEPFNDNVHFKIQHQIEDLQERLTDIKEWCVTEMNKYVPEISPKTSTDSNSDIDNNNSASDKNH